MILLKKAHYLVLVSLFCGLGLLYGGSMKANAHGSLEFCSNAVQIVQPSTTTASTASGVLLLDIMTAPNAQHVMIEYGGTIIGQAQSINSTNDHWKMQWDTRFVGTSAAKPLSVEVLYQSGNMCVGQSSPQIAIANPTQLTLAAAIAPQSWQGVINSVALFDIEYPSAFSGDGTNTVNVAEYADVTWTVSTVGSISNKPGGIGRFSAGPAAGKGSVKAIIRYGGAEIQREAAVDVLSDAWSNSADTSQDTGRTNPDQSNSGAQLVTIGEYFRNALQVDNALSACASKNLGSGLDGLLNDNRRPNQTEFNALVDCFAPQNYVVPSFLAPVAPKAVKTTAETKNITFNDVLNRRSSDIDGRRVAKLVFSGTSAPGSKVLLYMFSEPLVLVATADDSGSWEYALEDPLPPGKHDVYAVVDRGDGEYERSGLLSFLIGTAEATEANPTGLSLNLASDPTIETDQNSISGFLAVTIGLVAFGVTCFIGFLFHQFYYKKRQTAAHTDNQNSTKIDDIHR